jgi:hypothetical protein
MQSSVPGFGGMIQAYLDIPPLFTGEGIENTIGSTFLSSFQSVLDDASIISRPTFWFFTDQMLFAGSSQAIVLSSTGEMEFGVSIPEPGTTPLLAGALGLLLAFEISRMHKEGRTS